MRAGLEKIFDPAAELHGPYAAQILDGCNHYILVRVGKRGSIDFTGAADLAAA